MVGLAKELEGEPFHLIASYNQRGNATSAAHEIFQNGLSLTTANVSATLHTRHPGVTGTGYVPYYLVFDHHGDLAYHHQGGPYHGGDGTAVLDRVRKMVAVVPEVYVGKGAYVEHHGLSERIATGRNLGAQLQRLARLHKESPDNVELIKLVKAVERYSRERVRRFERHVTVDPLQALRAFERVAKAYRGTPYGTELVKTAERWSKEEVSKAAVESAKVLKTAMKSWLQTTPIKGNGGSVRNPLDREFRSQNEPLLAATITHLKDVSAKASSAPGGSLAQRMLRILDLPEPQK